MRSRLTRSIAFSSLLALLTAAMAVSLQAQSGVTYEALTVSTTAVPITASTIPARIRSCEVRVETSSVRYRLDGVNPTSTNGTLLLVGETYRIAGLADAETIRFIRAAGETVDATLRVTCSPNTDMSGLRAASGGPGGDGVGGGGFPPAMLGTIGEIGTWGPLSHTLGATLTDPETGEPIPGGDNHTHNTPWDPLGKDPAISGRASTLPCDPITLDTADIYATVCTDERGQLRMSPPKTVFRSLDLDETEEEASATPRELCGFNFTNTSTSTRWLKVYNATAANVTVGTTVPVLTYGLPGNSADDIAGNFATPNGCLYFDVAITLAVTTGPADNNTGAPGTGDVVVNVFLR